MTGAERLIAEGFAERYAMGYAFGYAEGYAESLVKAVLMVLNTRFGPVPESVANRVSFHAELMFSLGSS